MKTIGDSTIKLLRSQQQTVITKKPTNGEMKMNLLAGFDIHPLADDDQITIQPKNMFINKEPK
jgi:hypothetical protein